jgi:hypothetical protein
MYSSAPARRFCAIAANVGNPLRGSAPVIFLDPEDEVRVVRQRLSRTTGIRYPPAGLCCWVPETCAVLYKIWQRLPRRTLGTTALALRIVAFQLRVRTGSQALRLPFMEFTAVAFSFSSAASSKGYRVGSVIVLVSKTHLLSLMIRGGA